MTTLISKDGHEFQLSNIDCPTCGLGAPQELIGMRGGDYHRYGLGVATQIVRCESCGLLFPNPFPFPSNPQELYGDPAKYFAAHDGANKLDASRRLVRGFLDQLGKSSASLLDVGSGRGEMLGAAREEGLSRVVGLEFSSAMIAEAKSQYDVEVLPLEVEKYADSTDERFDIIVLNAVLEHVYNPNSMIAACAQLLTPDGLLYLDLPNEDHLLAKVGGLLNSVRKNKGVYVLAPTFPPYHVFGFSPRSLEVLLSKHGLRVDRLEVRSSVTVPSSGGLVDWFRSYVATGINVVANRIDRGHNMFVWARPRQV